MDKFTTYDTEEVTQVLPWCWKLKEIKQPQWNIFF